MRKLAAREAEMAAHIATANAERERIDQWLSEVNEPLTNDCSYFTGLLTEWAAGQIESELGTNPLHGPMDPDQWKTFKHKTRKLPGGDVSAKIGTGRFATTAPDATIAALEEIGRDDLIVREPKVKAGIFDKACADPEAGVRLADDGTYMVLIAHDSVEDSQAGARLLQAFESGAHPLSIIDTFSDVLPAANELDLVGRVVRLSMTALVSEVRVETWLVLPGVAKEGVGLVNITVKARPE